jgi:hypothetical protein
MRFFSLPVISILFLLVVSGCATSSQQKALAQDVQQLKVDVAVLKETLRVSKTPIILPSSSFGARSRSSERVLEIAFPADPTAENLKNYINEIVVASQGNQSYSTQDPQIAMLALVGTDNLQLLVNAMPDGASGGMGVYYVEKAISLLVEDRHRDLILEALPVKQRLVSVVLEKRWEREARDILIAGLKESNGAYLPGEWVKAVAALRDPETYDVLTEYMAKTSSSPSYVYESIRLLPGIQLGDAVSKAWEKAKGSDNQYNVAGMAVIAASYGHPDAVETLIGLLKNPPGRTSSFVNPRLSLLLHLDTSGSNEEIIAWYETNKENLVFDPKSKKFKLKS